jgi:hypothetical protein
MSRRCENPTPVPTCCDRRNVAVAVNRSVLVEAIGSKWLRKLTRLATAERSLDLCQADFAVMRLCKAHTYTGVIKTHLLATESPEGADSRLPCNSLFSLPCLPNGSEAYPRLYRSDHASGRRVCGLVHGHGVCRGYLPCPPRSAPSRCCLRS